MNDAAGWHSQSAANDILLFGRVFTLKFRLLRVLRPLAYTVTDPSHRI